MDYGQAVIVGCAHKPNPVRFGGEGSYNGGQPFPLFVGPKPQRFKKEQEKKMALNAYLGVLTGIAPI